MFFHFPDTCRTRENQNRLIQSRKINYKWTENLRLSQKERFLESIKKVLMLLITCELVSTTLSIALFWWSQRFKYFSSLFYFSFVIDNMKPTFLNCLNFTIVEVTWNILIYKIDVLYIFDIIWYEICKFIWFLIW